MSRIMLFLGLEYIQVAPPIIGLVSVSVMDHLSLLQFATQLRLCNITMHRFSRVTKPLVALLVLEQPR